MWACFQALSFERNCPFHVDSGEARELVFVGFVHIAETGLLYRPAAKGFKPHKGFCQQVFIGFSSPALFDISTKNANCSERLRAAQATGKPRVSGFMPL